MKEFRAVLFLITISIGTVNGQSSVDIEDSTSVTTHLVKRNNFLHAVKTPAIFMGAGLVTLTDNEFFSDEEIAEERNEHIPQFHTHADDYIMFAPIAVVYGLNLVGVKGKNNFGNRTALLIKSELIMMALVSPMKVITHRLRPDGSAYTSFPSGHTAEAFVAATFLQKEYGHLSPWYGIGAYSVATAVGVMRILNNRHFASDVLMGAGIGILSTNLAYLTHKNKWSDNKKNKLVFFPEYTQGNLGFYLNLKI